MSRVEVLFFAADPLSADGYQRRLMLDEEVRQVREKVRAARYRDDLRFDTWWATRTDDLLQALNESEPDIVHFSGHGGSAGLVLVSADGKHPHYVSAPALSRLFRAFGGKIRVVVLNACTSLPQAQAIADAVGCAVGTPSTISDDAAITFAASFYRGIAFGQSVQTAFDRARAGLSLENFSEGEHPVLITRDDVDASRLFFISPEEQPAAQAVSALEEPRTGARDAPGAQPRVGMPAERGAARALPLRAAGAVGVVLALALPGAYALRGPIQNYSRIGAPSDSTGHTIGTVPSPPVPARTTGSVVEHVRHRIGPGQFKEYGVTITDTRPCRLRGRVQTVSGGDRDIDVLLLEGDEFESFRGNHGNHPFSETRRTTEVSLDVPLPGPGQYHFVISNRFSAFVSKVVLVEDVRWECGEGSST